MRRVIVERMCGPRTTISVMLESIRPPTMKLPCECRLVNFEQVQGGEQHASELVVTASASASSRGSPAGTPMWWQGINPRMDLSTWKLRALQWTDRTLKFMEANARLGQWVDLPGLGGNQIQLVPLTNEVPLVYFPWLVQQRLTVRFRSAQWYGGHEFVLELGDALAPCIAVNVWIICVCCGKFHFPPTGFPCHRTSKKHQKKLADYASYGADSWLAYNAM